MAKHKNVTRHPGRAPVRPVVTPVQSVATPVQAVATPSRPAPAKKSIWGHEKAEQDAVVGEFVSSDSDESDSESWEESGGDGSGSESGSAGVGVFRDEDWSLLARCEVEEGHTDEWRGADIWCQRDNPKHICLHLGGDEYEGLPGGTYRFERGDKECILYDGDGEVIEMRDVCFYE